MAWSIFLWVVAIVLCLGIVRCVLFETAPDSGLRFGRALELLLPMWLPISVMILAVLLLFGTEQGRDLGVGLLDNGVLQLFLLALALLYWATGSWHVARLGLNRQFGTVPAKWPPGYEPWLSWLPRLIGACAHFLAALSLALAARHAIDPNETLIGSFPLWPVAFVPPAVIVVGTIILWLHDRNYVAACGSPASKDACYRAKAGLRRAVKKVIIGLVVVIGVLLLLGDRLQGLVPATVSVLASAAVFLFIVSTRRLVGKWLMDHLSAGTSASRDSPAEHDMSKRLAGWLKKVYVETDQKPAQSSNVLAAVLSAVALLVGAWAWWRPVDLGAYAGSMVISFFAFGAYIAIIDLVRLFSKTNMRFAAICTFLLLLAISTSAIRDSHRVRLCGDPWTPCAARTWVDTRPSVEEAARAWYAQATKEWPKERPVPMLIIATAGGGIRAAYWTATVLERLEQDLGPELIRRHLFAISGVSGGSVGAAAYVAAVDVAPVAPTPTTLLKHDFLAPALATLAFVDVPSSILPDFGQLDRSYALERTWELASGEVLARPFLSFFPTRQELEGSADWRPALLLNATHQNTGKRVITSHLKVESHVFLDSFDAHDLLRSDMPASTAAHNSARFSYISPAGKLISRGLDGDNAKQLGFILDGGYFENFGAITAMQLGREARRVIGQEKVRLIILQISSDPSLTTRDRPRLNQDVSLCDISPKGGFLPFQYSEWEGLRWRQRDNGGVFSPLLNEVTAPIAGVLASREAHGTLASQELAYEICAERRALEAGTRHLLDNALIRARQPPAHHDVVTVSDEGTPQPAPDRNPLLSQLDRRPEFAHLAMCDEAGATVPPLGWVLSPSKMSRFTQILDKECMNAVELEQLTAALR